MFELTAQEIPLENIMLAEYAYEHNIAPISFEGNNIKIGMLNKSDRKLINDLAFDTGYNIIPIQLKPDEIVSELKKLYPDYEPESQTVKEKFVELINEDSSTVDYVNQIISGAITNKASDIHFEVLEESLRVRYRVDGHLSEISKISVTRSPAIVSRLKIMATLDISEKRRPQDGRIRFNYNGFDVDIRISTIPTNKGEKVVLRILDKSNLKLDLKKLGLSKSQQESVKRFITLPYGMILVTGPTGSGKTTTLYASLQEIHTTDKNIITVEDPVEYNIEGINQCSVKPDIGFTFANALRSFLRQDPDIIMVGEIRDKETAEIAIRSSLTGHLVFSTLHTNDSITGVSRLVDMGIEPYLAASSVKLIIAQRLIRTICECKKEVTGKQINEILEQKILYTNNGCAKCSFTGYTGRIAIYEMFEITEDITELIVKGASVAEIRKNAVTNGFKSLREAGLDKVKLGITTYEEVIRETML